MDLIHFLDSLGGYNFDMDDADGETPLFYALSSKNIEMTKFFI